MGKRAGIAVVLVALIALVVPASRSDAAYAPPAFTVYAHRGGGGLAPENTLGAFRQTHAAYGAKGVWLEMDTQLTADNQLVVIHDDSLDRTTLNCTGTVISHTLAQIAPCDARKTFPTWPTFEPVPTMAQVLTEGKANGWRLMVELKDIPGEANFDATGLNAARVFINLVKSVGFPLDHLIVQSFWPPSLDWIEALLPAVPTTLLTSATLPKAPTGLGVPVLANVLYSTLRRYEIVAPDSTRSDLTPLNIRIAHLLGRRVVPYTPDTAAAITDLRGRGVDGVITNFPNTAYSVLGS